MPLYKDIIISKSRETKETESLIQRDTIQSTIVGTDSSLEEVSEYSIKNDEQVLDVAGNISKHRTESSYSTVTADIPISEYSKDCGDMVATEIDDLSLVTENISLQEVPVLISCHENKYDVNYLKSQVNSIYNDKCEINNFEDCSEVSKSKKEYQMSVCDDYIISQKEGSISEVKNSIESRTSSVIYSDKSLTVEHINEQSDKLTLDEYVSGYSAKSLTTDEYISEHIDKSFTVDEYLSEYTDKSLTFDEYVSEQSDQSLTVDEILSEHSKPSASKNYVFSNEQKLNSAESSIDKVSFALDSTTVSEDYQDVQNPFCAEINTSVPEISRSEISNFSTDETETYSKLENKEKVNFVNLGVLRNSQNLVKCSNYNIKGFNNSVKEKETFVVDSERTELNNSSEASSQNYISVNHVENATNENFSGIVSDAGLAADFKEFQKSDIETGLNVLIKRLQKRKTNVANYYKNKSTLKKQNPALTEFLSNKLQRLQYKGPHYGEKLKNFTSYLTTEETVLRADVLERLKIRLLLNKIDEDAADIKENLHDCRKCKSCQHMTAKFDEKLFLQDMVRRVRNKLYSKDLKDIMLYEAEISS